SFSRWWTTPRSNVRLDDRRLVLSCTSPSGLYEHYIRTLRALSRGQHDSTTVRSKGEGGCTNEYSSRPIRTSSVRPALTPDTCAGIDRSQSRSYTALTRASNERSSITIPTSRFRSSDVMV